jgi:hypothetical protein
MTSSTIREAWDFEIMLDGMHAVPRYSPSSTGSSSKPQFVRGTNCGGSATFYPRATSGNAHPTME